jgi:hypothetical protein
MGVGWPLGGWVGVAALGRGANTQRLSGGRAGANRPGPVDRTNRSSQHQDACAIERAESRGGGGGGGFNPRSGGGNRDRGGSGGAGGSKNPRFDRGSGRDPGEAKRARVMRPPDRPATEPCNYPECAGTIHWVANCPLMPDNERPWYLKLARLQEAHRRAPAGGGVPSSSSQHHGAAGAGPGNGGAAGGR